MSESDTEWDVTKNGEVYRFTLDTDSVAETPNIRLFDIDTASRQFVVEGELPVGASLAVEAVGEPGDSDE